MYSNVAAHYVIITDELPRLALPQGSRLVPAFRVRCWVKCRFIERSTDPYVKIRKSVSCMKYMTSICEHFTLWNIVKSGEMKHEMTLLHTMEPIEMFCSRHIFFLWPYMMMLVYLKVP